MNMVTSNLVKFEMWKHNVMFVFIQRGFDEWTMTANLEYG